MNQRILQIALVALLSAALFLTGCGFQPRSAAAPSLDQSYSVRIESPQPELKALLSLELRSRGFEVVEAEFADFVFSVLDEYSSDTTWGVTAEAATQVATLTYNIDFLVRGSYGEPVLPTQTKTWKSVYSPTLQTTNTRDIVRLTDIHNLRRKAAYELSVSLTNQVLSLDQ